MGKMMKAINSRCVKSRNSTKRKVDRNRKREKKIFSLSLSLSLSLFYFLSLGYPSFVHPHPLAEVADPAETIVWQQFAVPPERRKVADT